MSANDTAANSLFPVLLQYLTFPFQTVDLNVKDFQGFSKSQYFNPQSGARITSLIFTTLNDHRSEAVEHGSNRDSSIFIKGALKFCVFPNFLTPSGYYKFSKTEYFLWCICLYVCIPLYFSGYFCFQYNFNRNQANI